MLFENRNEVNRLRILNLIAFIIRQMVISVNKFSGLNGHVSLKNFKMIIKVTGYF